MLDLICTGSALLSIGLTSPSLFKCCPDLTALPSHGLYYSVLCCSLNHTILYNILYYTMYWTKLCLILQSAQNCTLLYIYRAHIPCLFKCCPHLTSFYHHQWFVVFLSLLYSTYCTVYIVQCSGTELYWIWTVPWHHQMLNLFKCFPVLTSLLVCSIFFIAVCTYLCTYYSQIL